jgi:hypothetical protein
MGYEWDDYEIYPSGNGGNWKSLNSVEVESWEVPE